MAERMGLLVAGFNFSTTPGDSLRSYFTSHAATMHGSFNLAGISDPAVDALVDKILQAETRGDLTIACRALKPRRVWLTSRV